MLLVLVLEKTYEVTKFIFFLASNTSLNQRSFDNIDKIEIGKRTVID